MDSLRPILRFIITVFASYAILAVGGLSLSARDRDNLRIVNPSPGEFPIVALGVFNSQVGPGQNDLKGIDECGFNLCMQITNTENTEKMLDYIKNTGLRFIPGDFSFVIGHYPEDKWKEEMQTFIKRFKNNPKVAGWILYDEPKWNQLMQVKERYDVLLDADGTHFVSLNFVGELEKSHTGPCGNMPAYLDSIQNEFGSLLDVWSFDCYPMWIRDGQFLIRYREFYSALEAYANKSKETGIPMWSYCESMAFKSKHHDIPPATEPHLSFEAFSALAYGAQGIVYWTYSMRPSSPTETYISALVDMDGNRTPAWYAAQSVNRQIRALTPVFLGAQMEEVRHSGNIPLKDIRPFVSDFGPIDRLTNEDKGVLVSHLTNNGKDYLVIVNHDVQNKQSIRIKFKNDIEDISRIEVTSAGNLTRKNVEGVQKVTLTPGGYAVYQWQ